MRAGALIGVFFGLAWGVAGAATLARPSRGVAITVAIAVSVGLAIATFRARATPGQFDGAVYGIAVAGEAIGIVIAARLLQRSDNQSLIPPVVAAIVGLHFIGLWRATLNIVFVWLAGALCIVGLIGVLVPPAARLPVAGIGSALALWTSVARTVLR